MESAATAIPPGVHWYRTAAEQRAVYEEVYRWAGAAVRTPPPPGRRGGGR